MRQTLLQQRVTLARPSTCAPALRPAGLPDGADVTAHQGLYAGVLFCFGLTIRCAPRAKWQKTRPRTTGASIAAVARPLLLLPHPADAASVRSASAPAAGVAATTRRCLQSWCRSSSAPPSMPLIVRGIQRCSFIPFWPGSACAPPASRCCTPPPRRPPSCLAGSFEGAVGAMGAPLVGLTAERVFGFRGVLGTGGAGARGGAGGRAGGAGGGTARLPCQRLSQGLLPTAHFRPPQHCSAELGTAGVYGCAVGNVPALLHRPALDLQRGPAARPAPRRRRCMRLAMACTAGAAGGGAGRREHVAGSTAHCCCWHPPVAPQRRQWRARR